MTQDLAVTNQPPSQRALKPCPFPHEVKRGVFLDIDEEDFAIVRGACSDCGACGPFVNIEKGKVSAAEKAEATRLWNTRSGEAEIVADIVAREPTEAMIEAGARAFQRAHSNTCYPTSMDGERDRAAMSIWAAMYEAALTLRSQP